MDVAQIWVRLARRVGGGGVRILILIRRWRGRGWRRWVRGELHSFLLFTILSNHPFALRHDSGIPQLATTAGLPPASARARALLAHAV